MIQQASAWGQFWFVLSARYRVQGSAIYTPEWHQPRPQHRGKYYSTWAKWNDAGPVYYSVNGDTMVQMLRNGLEQTGCYDVRMGFALLAVLVEQITQRLER